ncbi:ABC transporter substrate-binding protein [Clostridium culturomicium]|uniref:ABC transporter substrate-binding protein n=1 Tax=Clostridium culturomicium TaxID=1499683 RepID=UPI00058C20CF|nr:ABC transporter substrate-binding protein [Clostridium culturomicium]
MKKILAFTMIVMIIFLGISIERDISVVDNKNPYDQYINYNMAANPENLKLTATNYVREKDLLINLFQGLVKEDENGKIVGALAEEFQVSEDGLEYNFKLRDNIYYSTGSKITSKDFVDFFKSFLDDESNIYRSDLDFIYGVKDYREGRIDFSQVAIISKDDMLTIRLNNPCPYFLEILSHPIYVLRDYEKLNNYKNRYNEIRYTGPFIIKSVLGDEVILSKNERYYNSKNITDEEIRISFIDSAENALAIFEDTENKTGNKVDVMMDVPVNEVYRLKKQNMIKSFAGNESLFLSFNDSEERISGDIKFRIAVKDSLNREVCSESISESLLNTVYSSVEAEGKTLEVFKPQFEGNAKKYFKDLNKERNSKIIVIYEDKSLQRRVAKELCEELSKATGMEFEPMAYSSEEIKNVIEAGEYDICISSFQYKYEGEFEYLNQLAAAQGNEECKDKVHKTLYIMDEDERNTVFEECEQILSEKLSQIPLYEVNNVICYKNEFSGFYVNKRGNIDLEMIKRVR